MTDTPERIVLVGAILLLGLLAEMAARRTRLPRVTLLLLLGIFAGPSALNLIPEVGVSWFPAVANVALVMIGFLLGGEFTRRHVREIRGVVLGLASIETLTTAAIVGAGFLLLGFDVRLALPLAGIAAATAPAATLAILQETGARGRFSDILKGVVAVDDVMAILLFSLFVATAGWLTGEGVAAGALLSAMREIGGAIVLGGLLGLVAAPFTGRIRPGHASLEEAVGLVLVCTGLAMWLDVAAILAGIVMGGTIANLARHHERAFHEIERIEWPFLVVFFLLAGAALDLKSLTTVGPALVAYLALRAVGKLLGPRVGSKVLPHASGAAGLGMALMPQAGVALGLALAAAMRFPVVGSTLLNIVIAGTVVFELTGPLLTRWALARAGALPVPEPSGDPPM